MSPEVQSLPGVSFHRRLFIGAKRAVGRGRSFKALALVCVAAYALALSSDKTIRFAVSSWFGRVNKSAGFVVKDIYLEGVVFSDAEAIEKLVGPYRGKPLLSVPLTDIKSGLEKLSWSDIVLVERMFPSTLSIRVREHKPVAVWQHGGRFYLVNSYGEVIAAVDEYSAYGELMLVTGARAVEHVRALTELLSRYPTAAQYVASAAFVGERRWDLYLKNGSLVRLPEDKPEAVIKNVVKMIDNGVLGSKPVKTVDLKEPGRIYIEMGTSDSGARAKSAP